MANNNYKIEKGIPITNNVRGEWSKLATKMEDSDSVITPDRAAAMNLRNAIVKQGFKAVTRTVGKDQIRVWKVKKD